MGHRAQALVTHHQMDIGALEGLAAPLCLAFDVYRPSKAVAQPLLLFCTPGGGMRRGYYDLDDGGTGLFSFAQAMTGAGHYVVTVDPLGVGESDRPDDGFLLNPYNMAEANRKLAGLLRTGAVIGEDLAGLPMVGVGHSAGAILTVLGAAGGAPFSALLLLCFADVGLPELLNPEEARAAAGSDRGLGRVEEFARARFGDTGYIPVVMREGDAAAAVALRAQQDLLVANLGQFAMMPGNIRSEMAALSVPIMVSVGDRDMTGAPYRIAGRYEKCPDFHLYVLESAGHHLFVAPTAQRFYARAVNWLQGMAGELYGQAV